MKLSSLSLRCGTGPTPEAPFGGMKTSGIGRDGGDYSFDFYMETKNVCIAADTHTVPTLGH